MTEAEWLAAADPVPMIACLQDSVHEPRLRRFAVGCCCRIADLLSDRRSITALQVADRWLDGLASMEEMQRALQDARQAYENAFQKNDHAASSVLNLAADGREAARTACLNAEMAVSYARGRAAERWETQIQADLLRHIIGNPFHPYLAPPAWPETVVDLASAVAARQDGHFALHDALLEAGHPQLAEHFQDPQHHPKGCWALDLILGLSQK